MSAEQAAESQASSPPSSGPQPPPVASPAAAPSLAQQYELGDVNADDTGYPDSPPAPAEGPPASSSTPPRDPETGRFLPRQPEPQPTSEPSAPQHPRYLTQQAIDLGFAESEIAELPTEQLAEQVYRANRAAVRRDRDHQRDDAYAGATERRPQEPAPVAESAPDEDYKLQIDESKYDEELLGEIRRLGKSYQQDVKSLRAEIAELRQAELLRQGASLVEQCDHFFAKHETVFGKGRQPDLDPKSPEYRRRMATIIEAEADKSNAPWHSKLEKARSTLFGTVQPPAPPVPSTTAARRGPTPEEWARAGVQRPTHREGSEEPPGEEKARKNLAVRMREMGIGEEQTDENGFLE